MLDLQAKLQCQIYKAEGLVWTPNVLNIPFYTMPILEVSNHGGNTYSVKLDINCLVKLRLQIFKTHEFVPLRVLGGVV